MTTRTAPGPARGGVVDEGTVIGNVIGTTTFGAVELLSLGVRLRLGRATTFVTRVVISWWRSAVSTVLYNERLVLGELSDQSL